MELLDNYDSESDASNGSCLREGDITITTDVQQVQFVRNRPHVIGDWAGSCYCSVDVNLEAVSKTIQEVVAIAKSRAYVGSCLKHSEFHVSVSKSFFLQESNIAPFVEAVSKGIRSCQLTDGIEVVIDYRNPTILQNDEATRSFIAWPVWGRFSALVEQVDGVLARYDQPKFYVPPLFHVSIASFFPPLFITLPSLDINLEENWNNDKYPASKQTIHHVSCKFGTTQLYTIPLGLGP